MAGVRQCIGIDIGSHSVRIAEAAVTGNSVAVRKLIEARLDIQPGQTEAQRQSAIVAQINSLLKTNKVKSREAVFCVPGQTVFVRRFRLPATTPERLDRIVRFEAREQIPFPLEKTNLEYQVFPSDQPNEVEVLLVAIRRDFMENFMKIVNKSGLKPLAISVSSLAVHNFHELNVAGKEVMGRDSAAAAKKNKAKSKAAEKPGAKKAGKRFNFSLPFGKKKPAAGASAGEGDESAIDEENAPYDSMEMGEIQVQVNLGATIMDLAIPKAGHERLLGFTRSVPVAGGQIDRAIRGKMSLGSLEEAQRVKEQETVILASDFEISGDTESVNMVASQAATAVADTIIGEIRKSLDFFISQPDGVAADSVVLSGGLARMRYLSNYLEERMGLPVELASVKNELIKVPDESADSVSSFVIPIGLALQGLGLTQIQVDFLPQDFKSLRAFKEKRGQFISAGVLAAACLFLSTTLGSNYVSIYKNLSQQYEESIAKQTADQKKIRTAEADNKRLADAYDALAKLQGNRTTFLETLIVFTEIRPPDILIDRATISKQGLFTVEGRTPRGASVGQFLDSMKPKVDYLASGAIETIAAAPVEDPRFKNRVIPFTLRIATRDRSGRSRSIRNSESLGNAAKDPNALSGVDKRTAVLQSLKDKTGLGGSSKKKSKAGDGAAPPPGLDN